MGRDHTHGHTARYARTRGRAPRAPVTKAPESRVMEQGQPIPPETQSTCYGCAGDSGCGPKRAQGRDRGPRPAPQHPRPVIGYVSMTTVTAFAQRPLPHIARHVPLPAIGRAVGRNANSGSPCKVDPAVQTALVHVGAADVEVTFPRLRLRLPSTSRQLPFRRRGHADDLVVPKLQ